MLPVTVWVDIGWRWLGGLVVFLWCLAVVADHRVEGDDVDLRSMGPILRRSQGLRRAWTGNGNCKERQACVTWQSVKDGLEALAIWKRDRRRPTGLPGSAVQSRSGPSAEASAGWHVVPTVGA